MSKLIVVGMDPSLRHWGLCKVIYDTETEEIEVTELGVIEHTPVKTKQVRVNSNDLETAQVLSERITTFIKGADVVFVEVPVGSQSARSMASYGVCIGILGFLRSQGVSFFEITPSEVKLAAVGNKTASKNDMISWASTKHPEAPWPTTKRKGVMSIVSGTAEHMADALASIYAGLKLPLFKQSMSFYRKAQT